MVLDSARDVGVQRFVNIGYKPERWRSSLALRDANPDIEIALGLHPQESSLLDAALGRSLRDAVETLCPIAIGETGFDFARATPDFANQQRAFQIQLGIAEAFSLPVIIHQRDAAAALMTELNRWPDLAPIVLHSFDGDERLTGWAMERRCFIGVGGLACKPKSTSLRELLKQIPIDRLLLETDSPFLPPPEAKSRRNSPEFLPAIAMRLAPIWRLTAEDLCRVTTANAEALFGFARPSPRLD
jgi:TatD DNase family protein